MCFDRDPPDTVFLWNAGVVEAQKFEAKVYLERRQVLAGQAQPKEQTVGMEGTTTQSVMAALPQGGSCHVRHCSHTGTGENLGIQPRAPTLHGGAHHQKPHEQGPTGVSLLP